MAVKNKNNCAACGKCCKEYASPLHFNRKDVGRAKERRPAVLDYLVFISDGPADAFFSPVTGRELKGGCPFLRKGSSGYYCDIYDVRPHQCRGFPWGEERDVCEVPLELINVEISPETD